MRRPVSVKTFLSSFLFLLHLFLLFPNCSHSDKPPLSPPFHPHSLLSDCRSVQVGCPRFSRCCYLSIDLCFPFSKAIVGPGLTRRHLIAAVELGCLDAISLFSLLLFVSAGAKIPIVPVEFSPPP